MYPSVMPYLKTKKLIPDEMSSLCGEFSNLILHSSTNTTWSRHISAWKLYNEFCTFYNTEASWPITLEKARAFTTWALAIKHLKSSTVKTYLSSMNVAHELGNFEHKNFNSDKCIKLALKGAENIAKLSNLPKPTRLAMNIHLLDILGHRIHEQTWSDFSKQVMWTVYTVCFYSSCRMGELTCNTERNYDKNTTLLWGNIKFLENKECIMFIPFTKTAGFDGCLVDIFPIKDDKKCPASAIVKLKNMSIELGIFDRKKTGFLL